jgi:hypothetical protein
VSVTLTFLGSGDAFGTDGRFRTCLALRGGPAPILVDCGASSLIAMKRFGTWDRRCWRDAARPTSSAPTTGWWSASPDRTRGAAARQ